MGGVLLNCDELKVRRLFHAVISSTTFSYISVGLSSIFWIGLITIIGWFIPLS